MSLHDQASELTLAQFLERRRKFYWVKEDGTMGPLVEMKYGAVPSDITRKCFSDLLHFSAKSAIQLFQLMTDEQKPDFVAAKIMQKPLDEEKLHSELNILRELRHNHVAAVIGSFTRRVRNEGTQTGILVFPLAVQNLGELLLEISSHNKNHENDSQTTWSPHRHAYKLLPYFACLCEAVLFLHKRERPVKHRDIKPENILIDRVNNVILADFDISKAYAGTKESITYVSQDGTVMYSSRDIFTRAMVIGAKRGLEWDVISLGFVFLEMATVVFGKSLPDMRADMYYPYNNETVVIYSAALADRKIEAWLGVLKTTAVTTPWKLPARFAELTGPGSNCAKDFLTAIKNMMLADRIADRKEQDPLVKARNVFGRLSESCPHCR